MPIDNRGNWNDKSLKNQTISTDYAKLIQLNKPFFRLKHGKFYECKVEHSKGIEAITIIPLVFEKNKNRQFVMADARKLFKENPKHVYEIIKMDFNYIMNDGIISDYPFEFEALTILCATRNDKTLLDYSGMTYFDFKETNEL